MAQSSMTSFWVKRILVMLAVIAAAIAFLIFIPEPGKNPNSEDASEKPSVAANVTRFYEAFKQVSRDPIKERYGDYVVLLDNQDTDVAERVKGATNRNYAVSDNWQGEFKERAFAKQSTLMTEANSFVLKEGYNFVWDLNQDFIIRERFISSNTLVGMLEEIAGAVDANFDHPIVVYFCHRKRTLVLTARASAYLKKNCEKSTGSIEQYY
ncbi:MAG: TcpQ domain-containing protein [Glaciecola sp.]